MDAKELRALAERCIRLAKAQTNEELAGHLRALSAEYQQRANAMDAPPVAEGNPA